MFYLDWLGNILIVLGLYLLGSKNRKAFILTGFGEFFWIIKSLYLGQYDLAFIYIIFVGLPIRNYLK